MDMEDLDEFYGIVMCQWRRLTNLRIRHTNYRAYVRIPGFKYDDFDRAGNVDCFRLMQIVRSLEFPWLRLPAERNDAVMFIVLGNHYEVSRRLYDRAAIDYPMQLSWWLGGVGRSSVDVATELRDESTGELLMANVIRVVFGDINTRKPKPLPDAFRRQALAACSAENEIRFPTFRLDPKTMTLPSSATFCCSVRVRFDDTDQLSHTTQAAYPAFMRECAAQAVAAGFFTRVTGDFAFYTVKSLAMVHTGESFAGDELRVTTWEDAANPLLLYFLVAKIEQTLCYGRMLMFEMIHSKM